MKRAHPGKSYRLQEKEKWSLHSTKGSMYHGEFRPDIAIGDVQITSDDVIMSLAPDMKIPTVRMGKEVLRTVGVWFFKGRVVYDTPIEAEHNGGREDNMVNHLVEV